MGEAAGICGRGCRWESGRSYGDESIEWKKLSRIIKVGKMNWKRHSERRRRGIQEGAGDGELEAAL